MLKAIVKALGWLTLVLCLPVILFIVWLIWKVLGPILAVLAFIFLPILLIGVIAGYSSGKKNNDKKEGE